MVYFLIGLMLLLGSPQGTVLGPLLFILYVNDLDSVIKDSTIKVFADDVLLYAPDQPIPRKNAR